MVGAWGFEPQTPTVSNNAYTFLRQQKSTKAAREVTSKVHKLIKFLAESAKILPKLVPEIRNRLSLCIYIYMSVLMPHLLAFHHDPYRWVRAGVLEVKVPRR
jgi:hypothetical protein